MSNSGTALAALRTRILGLPEFAAKTEMPNPYSFIDNQVTFIRDGWGIVIGDSSQGFNEFKSTWDDMLISIVITKELIKTESNPEPMIQLGKDILNESLAVRVSLLGETVNGAAKIDYISTDGFEFEDNIIKTAINFNFTIIEDL